MTALHLVATMLVALAIDPVPDIRAARAAATAR
jgi:hypothetical protein